MKYIDRLVPAPSEYGSSVIATPDGGFLYISMQCVLFVKLEVEKPLVKCFYTKQPITQIDIDASWTDKEKLFATLAVSNSVLIWNLDKNNAVCGHKAHCQAKSFDRPYNHTNKDDVHISFMKNRNLLSIRKCEGEVGELVVYCVASNSVLVRPNFINVKDRLRALKCSPYDEHIFACGTAKGKVLVCDLQKSCILYTFDGHEVPIVSLAWNAVDLLAAVAPTAPEKKLVKCAAVSSSPPATPNDGEDIFNIYDYDYLENEFGAPTKATSAIDDTDTNAAATELTNDPHFDFSEACESLKQEINALNDVSNKIDDEASACYAVTLAECQVNKNLACHSSGNDSNESTEGSLELVDHDSQSLSSSDESCHVDGKNLTITERDNKVPQEKQIAPVAVAAEVEEIAKYDILLASVSIDGKCYIRNITTGGACDQTKKSRAKFVGCKVLWPGQAELMILTSDNALVCYKLNDKRFSITDKIRAYKFTAVNSTNNASWPPSDKFDLARKSDLVWLLLKDRRQIVCVNKKTNETLLKYGTVTTNIPIICESPENTLNIALGMCSSSICLMSADKLSINNISLDYLPVRLFSPVKVFAWHSNGSYLAYGTLRGQIGFINLLTNEHVPFDMACARTIYSLAWFGDLLFCICNDNVYAYRKGSRAPHQLEGFGYKYSSIATTNEKYLVLGTSRGQLHIYEHKMDLNFEIKQKLEAANHYITDIVFNPIASERFAVAANEAYVYIFEMDVSNGMVKLQQKLDCGIKRAQISKVKWSNRQKDKLITSGFDGDLRIFDLGRLQMQQLIYHQKFHCPLFGAMFLPCDERYVLCYGKNITVEFLDTEESPNPDKYLTQSQSLDNIKWAIQSVVSNSAGGGVGRGGGANKQKRGKKLQGTLGGAAITTTGKPTNPASAEDLSDKIAEMEIAETNTAQKQFQNKNAEKVEQQPISNFLKNPQTVLCLITKEQNKNPLMKIRDFVILPTFKEKQDAVLLAKLFGQRIDAEKLLAAELANMKRSGSGVSEIATTFLNQVNGSLRTQILDAIQTRQLNEWHVSLAPSVSYSFWQKCCQAFAEQLLEQGYALQAASYMLTLHKQLEAIEMLISKCYFKEAMLIGRSYLDEKDTLFDEITEKWIDYLENEGNLHAAALICTVSRQYRRGYEILSKQRVASPEVEITIKLLKEHAH